MSAAFLVACVSPHRCNIVLAICYSFPWLRHELLFLRNKGGLLSLPQFTVLIAAASSTKAQQLPSKEAGGGRELVLVFHWLQQTL